MRRHPEDEDRFGGGGPACREVQALLDAWPDGELSPAELALLERHAADCPTCGDDLEAARKLAETFRALPALTCPPAVTGAVLGEAEAEARRADGRRTETGGAGAAGRRWPWRLFGVHPPARRHGSRPVWSRPVWSRPVWAAALVAALAAAGALLLPSRPVPAPSAQEVARAEVEMKLAFAYLSRVGRDAGVRVRDEVVASVIAPTRRAVALGEGQGPSL